MNNANSITPFEALAEGLLEAGVEQVFGLMGDDTVRLVTALIALGINYSDSRHENEAVAMAVGYASAASRLGVCVVSRGPGTTNALTGIVNASRGGAAVLIITGDEWMVAPRNSLQLPDAKSLNIAGIGASIGVPVVTPRTALSLRDALSDAMKSALTGETVILTLPRDLLEQPVASSPPQSLMSQPPNPRPAASSSIAAAIATLEKSRRPLIIAGGGAHSAGARDLLIHLADKIGGTLSTTLRGKDMFVGHPYDLGMVGSFSHSAGRRLIDQADCILVFGASLNRYTTNGGTSLPDVPLIQIDETRSHIGRFHRADVSVVGDISLVVQQLIDNLPTRSPADKPWHTPETRQLLSDFQLSDDFEPAISRWTMDPRSLILELDRVLPVDRAVVTDNGNFFGFVPPHIGVPSPDRFKLSSDFAVIGLGIGTAIGTAIARPGVATVLFIGDGAMLMSLGELETLARVDVPLLVVVMNDSAYGAERHFLELRGLSGKVAQFPDTDFGLIADAMGVPSATVRSIEELRNIESNVVAFNGPFLIDCKVTSTVVAPFLSEQIH